MINSVSSALYERTAIRAVTLRNRLGLAPMSQYMSSDGTPNEWHHRHYSDRSHAVGITIVEATAVSLEARVTPQDLVLDDNSAMQPWEKLARDISRAGSVPCLQLSHAGRKASRTRPWDGDLPLNEIDGGWTPRGPTEQPFAPDQHRPRPLADREIHGVVEAFVDSARLAVSAGFEAVEIHAGHGRLFHEFYSPRSNTRDGSYGGSFLGRTQLLTQTVGALREALGPAVPLLVRLSCSDWVDDGWTIDDSVQLSAALRDTGADLIDCTSGGIEKGITIPRGPGYQRSFARDIRRGAGIMTAAVGELTTLAEAESCISSGDADIVLMGRRLLTDPFYVARKLHAKTLLPEPYQRALPRESRDLVGSGTPEL